MPHPVSEGRTAGLLFINQGCAVDVASTALHINPGQTWWLWTLA